MNEVSRPRARKPLVRAAKGGRPPFVPTEQQRVLVERLSGLLIPHRYIASDWIVSPISVDTLRRQFRAELDRGGLKTAVRIRLLMLREAERGSMAALVYLIERLDPEFARGFQAVPVAAAADDGETGRVIIYTPAA